MKNKYFWLKTGRGRPTEIDAGTYTRKLDTNAKLVRTDGMKWIVVSQGNNFIWVEKEKIDSVLLNLF